MPSKTKESKKKATVKKISDKKTSEPKGEEIAEMILTQLKNIQSKLNDLNKRLSAVERINIQPMEYSSRLTKVEGRLGL